MPVKATLGPKTPITVAAVMADPQLVVGKTVAVVLGVREGKGEYAGRFSNTVKKWVVPAK
jgi:hypothetical protein